MPRYLTHEWLEGARRAIEADERLAASCAGVDLSVQQIVTDGPEGDVAYRVHFDHGSTRLLEGGIDDASVTFIQTWDTAVAIARGELSAQGAFMTGLIRVRGDLTQLVAHGEVLTAMHDVLADLREQTTY